jgi:capsular polysaccharide transport system permease protein
VEYPRPDARTAQPAKPKARHWAVGLSFLLVVILPSLASVGYLYAVAADQYASRVSFSIRGNESTGPISFLGALSQTVTVGGTDAEIVYDFVRSQQMVQAALAALPLENIYNLPENDLVFRLGRDQPIEDVVNYWNWMTSVSFDGGSGIVHFEARAFDPASAQIISAFVLDESTRIVNEISSQAREDAVSVARQVLTQAEDRLREVRRQIRAFRDVEQELDPSENARAALGLMATLRQQRAEAQVELDSYLSLVGPQGPRAPALRQQIESLEQRIEEERQRLGAGATGQDAADGRLFSDLMGDYEELMVELEFAQNAYVSALSSFEQAQVEARRQTRFLSPHIRPTLSVEAQYPQRALLALGIFAMLTMVWSVVLLIAYNVRDRR